MSMTRYDEETLAQTLRHLRPPPAAWVQAARELPALRSTIDELVARAKRDREYRSSAIEDLERALRAQGVEPTPRVVAEVRDRLAGDS
jgi:hypothetical protein